MKIEKALIKIRYAEWLLQEARSKLDGYTDVIEYDIEYLVEAKAFIAEAELLLKKTESKQPETDPFANTMLGEVPPVGNGEQSETHGGFMGATRAVRQNEQTKKPCTCMQSSLQQHCDNTCFEGEEFG